MKLNRLIILAGASLALFGCAGNNLEDYQGMEPAMQFDQFFSGPVIGHGVIEDRSGKIIKRFDVDMFGAWQGNEGTLAEHFVYYDGKVVDRAWHIQKTADNRYIGHADDIDGDAPGESRGMAIHWTYVMNVPTDNGKTYAISFDDWMYRMHDGMVLNRNRMSKLGVDLGSLSIVMQKEPAGTPNKAQSLIGKK